jgi:alpha-galactosidase
MVSAVTPTQYLLAVYQESIIHLEDRLPNEWILINGTYNNRLFLEVKEDLGSRRVQVHNCSGEELQVEDITFTRGIHILQVPTGGIATVTYPSAP